jgi:hypothetical protein
MEHVESLFALVNVSSSRPVRIRSLSPLLLQRHVHERCVTRCKLRSEHIRLESYIDGES